MKVYKVKGQPVVENEGLFYLIQDKSWDELMNRKHLYHALKQEIAPLSPSDNIDLSKAQAPIGSQEIWAAGVTYTRSREARMEESKKSGGATFYDKVYEAERPELFFKALAYRTTGPGEPINIRRDSSWDVPEPELTLWISSGGTIEGYTIGNDMSSRSIEGENPLYLPQAKVFDRCAGLGPCVYVPGEPLSPDTEIELEIRRNGTSVFQGKLPISSMKRKHEELAAFLFRECGFPYGCYLMTGTGIVPPDDFTLQKGDEIRITIDPVGTLTNFVTTK